MGTGSVRATGLLVARRVVVAQLLGCRSKIARFLDAARHRLQIGQRAFGTSLPLPTNERACRCDWVVGHADMCTRVPRLVGRTYASCGRKLRECVKTKAGIVCERLVVLSAT